MDGASVERSMIANAIGGLPQLERLCLAVLAAEVDSCARTQWAERLRVADVRKPLAEPSGSKRNIRPAPGNAVSTTDLSAMIARWRTLGLVVESDNGRFVCTPEAVHVVLSQPDCRELLLRLYRMLGDDTVNAYSIYARDMEITWLRRTRLALYCGDPADAERTFALLKARAQRSDPFAPCLRLLDPHAPVGALQLMSPQLQQDYFAQVLPHCLERLRIPSTDMLREAARIPLLGPLAATLAAIGGEVHADTWLEGDSSRHAAEARAACALIRGEFDDARERAAVLLSAPQPKGKHKPAALAGAMAPLLTLALATGSPDQVLLARTQLARVTSRGQVPSNYAEIASFLGEPGLASASGVAATAVQALCDSLAVLFAGDGIKPRFASTLERTSQMCRVGGARWLADELQAIVRTLKGEAEAGTAQPRAATRALTDLYRPQAPWERGLSLLESLQPKEALETTSAAVKEAADRRLVFLVGLSSYRRDSTGLYADPAFDYIDAELGAEAVKAFSRALGADDMLETSLSIEPKLQVRRGKAFSGGRPVALRALAEPDPNTDTDYLTTEDRRVAAFITSQRTWSGGREFFFSARAPLALAGHPRVFWRDRPDGPPVTVTTRAPVLKADRGPAGLRLRIEPAPNAAGVGLMLDGPDTLVVTELTQAQRNVHRTILALPPIPADGETRLRHILGGMASLFTVHSEFGVEGTRGALEELPSDSRPVLQLARAEPGLRVRISVQPLGPSGPDFIPAEGLVTVATDLKGRRVRCQRDLAEERRALDGLLEAAPALRAATGGGPLHVDTLSGCLSLLQALEALADAVVVRWLEGAPIAVVGEAELSSFRLVLDERDNWLQATGTLRVDESLVLDMQRVLEQRTVGGGYVALGDDRYLALSDELREQLDALEVAVDTGATTSDGVLRLPPIALGFVSPWLTQLRAAGGLKADKRTQAQLARIERAYADTPELPKTFEGELRPYQVAGYEFLSRLAQIGAGACLADDMGLGKTLMTLALLLSRAERGPALVVTPTSVRANWFDEALRFAPTLRMRRLDGADAIQLADLEPFDVLVCSYTVMAQRIEQLERVEFASVVLDEAQAIKNVSTQRARAALRLVGEARIALSGTPIENHLGDLLGLMSFLNPGLLGDSKSFEKRFSKPIQKERDPTAHEHLRRLIGPFVLRRRKNEVLRELPPRTEITLRVEPEAEEQAFTEALRRAALARLTPSDPARIGSAVSILAEITRLRRAACHPRLADPEAQCGAAKLERLVELVHELKEGGHRALVFSQFVDFLHLVRTRLEAEGVSYQYLDGSTPEANRKQAVHAFQAGEGDVFLISLRAGGFGLNLTAADYVIHLDPWWNPAVEAQASDRAHRIGQQRPVTIYRLINSASIEERVLALHDRKQALAEELLSDTAEATRLDAATLMALIRG